MVSFPSSPTTGQQYLTWVWDGTKWAPGTRNSVPECGRFSIIGSSPAQQVRFYPYKGDVIKINGLLYQIPVAGFSGLANNCYLNGVAGSSLAASTFYYVYVWASPSAGLVLDFSTTGYATSGTPGNVGVIIKSGDDTRTLVGIVYTTTSAPGSNSFNDDQVSRFVRGWFNRRSSTFASGRTWGPFDPAGAWVNQGFGVSYVAFAGDSIALYTNGWSQAQLGSVTTGSVGFYLNGTLTGAYGTAAQFGQGNNFTNNDCGISVIHASDGNNQIVVWASGPGGVISGTNTVLGILS